MTLFPTPTLKLRFLVGKLHSGEPFTVCSAREDLESEQYLGGISTEPVWFKAVARLFAGEGERGLGEVIRELSWLALVSFCVTRLLDSNWVTSRTGRPSGGVPGPLHSSPHLRGLLGYGRGV